MPVPDTTTFTLQNVVDEVNPTTDDLVDCFADANSGDFDGSYSQDKDELDDFRNYDATVTYTSFTIIKAKFSNSVGACDDTSTLALTKYHDGVNTLPVVNDIIYDDSNGSTLFNGGSFWRKSETSSIAWKINSSGVLTNKINCL